MVRTAAPLVMLNIDSIGACVPMFRLGRSMTILGVASACILGVTASAHAQLSGRHAGAGLFSTVDEAALGDTLLASVGLFVSADNYTAAGGIGVAGGALRGYAGGIGGPRGVRWSLGASYARAIATRQLAGPLRGVIGGELLGAVRHTFYAPHEAAAIGLTAPVGLSLGDPSGPSLGVYATPYAETGVVRPWVSAPCGQSYPCYTLGDVGLTHALGVGAGMRLSFGRLSAGIMFADMLRTSRRHLFYPGDAAIGLTYRLGR